MTRWMWRRLTGAAVAAFVAACEQGPTPPPAASPAQLHLMALVSAGAVTDIVVTVSAPDITPSLVFNFPVSNGVATGTMTVLAGSDRHFRISAFDAEGVETDRADTTIAVQSGSNPPLTVTLTPLTGSQPIVVTISGHRIEVQPTDTSLAVGTSAQFRARAFNELGTDITDQLTFGWASTNPSIASIDSQGVVTAHVVGTVSIVAVARGTAGVATLTTFAPPPAVAQVAFTTQPPSSVEGNVVITPAIAVSIRDSAGKLVPTGTVTMGIGTVPWPAPGSRLRGTLTVTAVNGVATFADLRIDKPGGDTRWWRDQARRVAPASPCMSG